MTNYVSGGTLNPTRSLAFRPTRLLHDLTRVHCLSAMLQNMLFISWRNTLHYAGWPKKQANTNYHQISLETVNP